MMNKPISCLLVEDNEDFVGLIDRAISELKQMDLSPYATLKTTPRLSEALEILKTYAIDVVLLDLHLDDSEPAGTVAAIKTIAEYAPIIVLSGIRQPTLPLSAVDHGAQQFIAKMDLVGDIADKLKWEINTAIMRHRRENPSGNIMRKLTRIEDGIKADEKKNGMKDTEEQR